MSKSNKSTVESNNAVESKNEVVDALTFDAALLLVPAKEHRSFDQADFDAVLPLAFPATVEEIKVMAKGLSHSRIFALATIRGKADCIRVAKLFLENPANLKPSAVASFKSVEKGSTTLFAGKTAYGIISAIK